MNKGSNSTKITISLKKHEREAIEAEARRQGITAPTLCADLVRLHIRTDTIVTPKRAARIKKENL